MPTKKPGPWSIGCHLPAVAPVLAKLPTYLKRTMRKQSLLPRALPANVARYGGKARRLILPGTSPPVAPGLQGPPSVFLLHPSPMSLSEPSPNEWGRHEHMLGKSPFYHLPAHAQPPQSGESKRAGEFSCSPRPQPRPLRRGNSSTECFSMSSPSVYRSLPPTRRCSSDEQYHTRYP